MLDLSLKMFYMKFCVQFTLRSLTVLMPIDLLLNFWSQHLWNIWLLQETLETEVTGETKKDFFIILDSFTKRIYSIIYSFKENREIHMIYAGVWIDVENHKRYFDTAQDSQRSELMSENFLLRWNDLRGDYMLVHFKGESYDDCDVAFSVKNIPFRAIYPHWFISFIKLLCTVGAASQVARHLLSTFKPHHHFP